MTIETARKAVSEALYQTNLAKVGLGHGVGGRQVALAVTKLEEALHWLGAGDEAVAAERSGEQPSREPGTMNPTGE